MMAANHKIPLSVQNSLSEVDAYVRKFPSTEVCGLVIDGVVVYGKNVHEHPHNDFLMDQKTFELMEWAIARGRHVTVYHSHVSAESADDFSPKDMASIYEDGELPWLLVDASSEPFKHRYFDPTVSLDYEMREWRWTCCNCYTLVRDWLRRELGIKLDPFILTAPNAWELEGWNEFEENIEKQGFTKICAPPHIKDVRRGDVILARVGRSKNPNHVAVMVDAARNEMLHQLQDSLSAIAPYSESWRKMTVGIYRHESQMGAS